jgi:hypothetical protein
MVSKIDRLITFTGPKAARLNHTSQLLASWMPPTGPRQLLSFGSLAFFPNFSSPNNPYK